MNPDEAEMIRSEWLEELKAAHDLAEHGRGRANQPRRLRYFTQQCDLLKARIELLESMNTDVAR